MGHVTGMNQEPPATRWMAIMRPASVTVAMVWMAAGCASYPKTTPLARYDLAAGYRFEQLPPGQRITHPSQTNSDQLFVVLAFSGGGTRAGALSYGVLKQLRDVRFHMNATGEPVECPDVDSDTCKAMERSLLDEVDVISSVSGGSFPAAYYALNGAEIFAPSSRYHRNFLYYPVQRELLGRTVYHPRNWTRLRSRVEIAADLYADRVFGSATFADLKSRPRPYVVMNATDMSTGSRFEFTQEQFDLLCADLDGMSIARAVAASSAFPGLLNSMTIDGFNRNRTDGGCHYDGPGSHTEEQRRTLPAGQRDWVDLALLGNARTENYYAAEQVLAYKDPDRRHLHLLDGGLFDNIGARSILQGVGTFSRPVKRSGNQTLLGGWSALSLMNQRVAKNVLVIVVNARTGREKDWDTKAAGPGTPTVINASSGIPMGNFTKETLTRLRELVKDVFPNLGAAEAPGLFEIEIAFQDLPEDERRLFGNMGTNFDLDRYEVDCLIDRGGSLLRNATFVEPSKTTFASFVRDQLKNGRIGTPSTPSPLCTQPDARQRIAVRHHYMDVSAQIKGTIGESDDVDGSQLSPAVSLRVTRPRGWGVMFDVGPQTFPIAGTAGTDQLRLGDLRLWAFMGGIGWTALGQRTQTTFGVSAGYGIGGFEPSLGARDAYGRQGLFALEGEASNAWLIKPQASFWYSLSDRWAATVSASYFFGRPTVRLTGDDGTAFSRRVRASAVTLGAGLGFRIF